MDSSETTQIFGHGNEHGTLNAYRTEEGLVWHTTHEKCDYHGPTGPKTKANFALTDAQEFALVNDLALNLSPDQRRALLAHLLETEAAERVETRAGGSRASDLATFSVDQKPFIWLGFFPWSGYCLRLDSSQLRTREDAVNACLCLAAALAEKRKRESEDLIAACEYCEATTTDPETPGWYWDDDAIWTCPKCQEREVSDV